jgi:hypothetical protein
MGTPTREAGAGMTHEGVHGHESYNGSGYFGYVNVSRCRRKRKTLNVNVAADVEKDGFGALDQADRRSEK